MRIRREQPVDIAAVYAVNRAAFASASEAALVDALRVQAEPLVSLVAEDAASIVGHICFSPVTLLGHAELKIMGLAPMAVLPAEQRRGIGSALIRGGLDCCQQLGCAAAVVLGVPMLQGRLAAQSWYNSGWTNRKPITIDHTRVSSTLSNFPMP